MRPIETWALATLALAITAPASAGSFDPQGRYAPDPEAAAFVDFGAGFDPEADRFVPAESPAACLTPAFEVVEDAEALAGGRVVTVQTNIFEGCSERFVVDLPKTQASYRATLWTRDGAIDAQMTVVFPEERDREIVVAKMAPTGRVTSDGWVELASNAFPVDGAAAEAVYLRVYDYDDRGSQIDALEVVPAGDYWESRPCSGDGDPICGEGEVCLHNTCRLGRLYVPPLPDPAIRGEMVDAMKSQLRIFFGGRKTRLSDLPKALDELDAIRSAGDPWTFWNGWGTAIRRLHDWHTRAASSIQGVERTKRLNVCFIEGDGDVTSAAWPKHPVYHDLLVSHTGTEGTHGIAQGDRLVAVDGQHPIAWALGLIASDWGYWRANDANAYAELAERMRGLILRHATTFSVIRCPGGACEAVPTVYTVRELPDEAGGQVSCDNRPFYHLNPNPGPQHGVGFTFYKGLVTESTPEEAIYGLMWDTLYGGGNPNGYVNQNLKTAFAEFKADARGVVLDHRAGNGGTLDGAETATLLVRPPEPVLVFASPILFGGWDGPETPAEGVAIFGDLLSQAAMVAGASDYDPDLPVALLVHRDGSASDFMPYAFKGASPKVRIFGPGPTAGAFSTFYELTYYGGISLQLASGDSIGADGTPLIGRGVVPDVVVLQTQSDLLAGKDTIHEAALAWLRTELKP